MGWTKLGVKLFDRNCSSIEVNGMLFGVFQYHPNDKKPFASIYRDFLDDKWIGVTSEGTIKDKKYGVVCAAFDISGIDTPDVGTILFILNREENKEALEKNRHLEKVIAYFEDEKKAGAK